MIDWLRKKPEALAVDLGNRTLPIIIRRHPTARRMVLRLASDGNEVRVTLPRWGQTAQAIAFVRLQSGWLAEQLARKPAPQPPGHGAILRYRGQSLQVIWDSKAPRRPLAEEGFLHIGGPEQSVAPRLQRWLQAEALHLLAADLSHFCGKSGLSAPALRLSRARQRWGSCSSDGTIRINWRLVQAPDPVRRSVVAHEVAHLVHFDHSPAFHATLAHLFDGDLAEANLWLKREGPGLYTAFG